jgi:DMSO/TMAO reductase YedYZ heme-binding membrane subunit
VHYYWLVKSDVRKPVAYGTLVALLLAWRLWYWLRTKNSRMPVSSDSFKDGLQHSPSMYRKHRSEEGPARSGRL